MKKLLIGLFCLMLSTSVSAEEVDPTTLFDSKNSFFKSMAFWSWSDVPGSITTFMDTDNDGRLDVVWAFPIIKDYLLPDCSISSEPEEQEGTITFSTCHITESAEREPHLYIVESKGWVCQTCPYLRIPEFKKEIRII